MFVSSRASLYQGDASQRVLTNCGARRKSISDDGFIDGIKSHFGLSGGEMFGLLRRDGQTERRAVKARGKGGVGRGRSYAGTQGGRTVSPRATCRHLHLEGSILWHKQLRAPPEDRLY